jgi:hypothetical protein
MGRGKSVHDSSSVVIRLVDQSDHRDIAATRDRSPGVPGSFVGARVEGPPALAQTRAAARGQGMKMNMTRGAVAIALLYAARRFYRNWGTTKEECEMRIPGDGVISEPADVTTEGIWIDAPRSAVWPWLVQVGQDRAGFYSSPGLQSAHRVHPEWQHLAPGDTVRLMPSDLGGRGNRLVLSVVEVIEQQAIVLHTNRGGHWDATCTFHLVPHLQDRCLPRQVIRRRIQYRGGDSSCALITCLVGGRTVCRHQIVL